MSPSTELQLRERVLAFRIQRIPCETAEGARRFLQFAYRAIKESAHPGLPALLQEYPVYAEVLRQAERFIKDGTCNELSEPNHSQLWESVRKLKIFMAKMTGTRALAGAILKLHAVLENVALAADGDVHWFNEAAGAAGLSAYLVRRSSEEGLNLPAVMYQERLFQEIFGG